MEPQPARTRSELAYSVATPSGHRGGHGRGWSGDSAAHIRESDPANLYSSAPTTRHTTNWSAWLPGTCQVGRLVRRRGWPPRHMLQKEVERRRGQGDLS